MDEIEVKWKSKVRASEIINKCLWIVFVTPNVNSISTANGLCTYSIL